MTDVKEFKLPDVGEGLTEAEIVRWHVQPGDRVEINQTIVEIETAKAIVELPCPYEGVVAALLVEEGRTVDVGTPIIAVDTSSGEASVATPTSEPPAQAAAMKEDLVPSAAVDPGTHIGPDTGPDKAERQPLLVGYGVKPGATRRRPRKRPAPAARPAGTAARALAKPPVRKMARDLGVDLSTVTGTGPHGTITRDDVRLAAQQRTGLAPAPQGPAAVAPPAPPQEAAPAPVQANGHAPAAPPGVREERIPVKGVRKSTAAAMVRSAFTAPQVTEFLQVDVTEMMETVRRLRELPEFAEVKVSPLLLVAKALLTAVRRHPMINSAWVDGNGSGDEIVVRHYVNLGIAVATPRGLLVPNIKDADRLTLPELAAALGELAETARAGRTQPADMANGTITITNIGVFGVDGGTPILTPGESAILAFGQVRDMPWVHEGELAIRKVTTLALSFDHRIVDGELGSAVLRDVGAMLENPLRLLAWS
ncbi:dihydrolipoamide acetyltransferase family protein [Thermomonospora cellulosilytica]|uniref:Dihydrolipoamide acetyltransferase component of pyruvate dehydrogenase complex n=1 Tax=Thermomonospora cellulosilytica TaxID=1411118 RepID=A0A7W3MVH3_9ACTN|nr:dihydrolipoamide acetyltransferase family protein [Thermomonospora cellulosilytica]MBA9002587.1 pyruvate dehydrogenase E2 component (dihydrolipoamide acetyltransferase) [Thermomonospora cellulosilytica]